MKAQKRANGRIGIFGGMFDPPHWGHLVIAEQARTQLKLDKVIFVPAFVPPHKQVEAGSTPLQRFQMTKLAIEGNSSFEVSRIELSRRGVSYTVDTLKAMKQKHPQDEFFLIVGSDNYNDFDSWRSKGEILGICTLAVYERRGFEARRSEAIPHVQLGSISMEISSTAVRKRARNGESIRYLVPSAVERLINTHHLYSRLKSE